VYAGKRAPSRKRPLRAGEHHQQQQHKHARNAPPLQKRYHDEDHAERCRERHIPRRDQTLHGQDLNQVADKSQGREANAERQKQPPGGTVRQGSGWRCHAFIV